MNNNDQPKAAADRQSETVELALELDRLQNWGKNNIVSHFLGLFFPFLDGIAGIVFFFINPLWIVPSLVYNGIGTRRLEQGDLDGARRALSTCRIINWILILIGLLLWRSGLVMQAIRAFSQR